MKYFIEIRKEQNGPCMENEIRDNRRLSRGKKGGSGEEANTREQRRNV